MAKKKTQQAAAKAAPAKAADEELEQLQQGDIEAAANSLLAGPEATSSWDTAITLVKTVRPVPWLLWQIIRTVYGKPASIGSPDYIAFDIIAPLVIRGGRDKTLGAKLSDEERQGRLSLEKAVHALGSDVAAALVLMHGVCRRISSRLAERMWKPIIDDALLRAQIGFHVGSYRADFGKGRGMLAGFSGRSGLAVQIASGDLSKAQRALEKLAAGMPMQDIGMDVYGCDPLQISAMTLAAAGCSSDAAYGIAAFNEPDRIKDASSRQFLWLAAFSVAEHLRMGEPEKISEEHWEVLHIDVPKRAAIRNVTQKLQRKGHSLSWVMTPQTLTAEDEARG